MKVQGPKDITGVERVAGPEKPKPQATTDGQGAAPMAAVDRVTLEAPQVAEMLNSVRQRNQANRAGRLKELEAALKGGTYRPDVGQLAEKLLSAAEIDARLRAMLRG
jgi:anti-sigma28 factor (negative regulator of flagellin synthesis)